MPVTVGAAVLDRYRRFSLYNSPFPAHDRGCAIDLYPDGEVAPSPVAGEVVETLTVRAPPSPDAAEHDHLLVVDAGDCLARLMHVDPVVAVGDRVAVGDPLGPLVRAGFFAPWVPNHLHLGFRDRDADPIRASGSLPIALDVDVRGLDWDGRGTVVETGETWARLDAPAHPDPGDYFVGLAGGGGVLDGGLPHYDGGGVLFGDGRCSVSVAGTRVGSVDGRDVTWRDCRVLANGEPVTGVALFCARDAFGAKLVGEAIDLTVGDDVAVAIEPRAGGT